MSAHGSPLEGPHACAPAVAVRAAATIRLAEPRDARTVACAVRELLIELGATPPQLAALSETALRLIEDEQAGVVLLASSGGRVVGVLGASCQLALHTAGRYCLIQDLWVEPAWRRRDVGAQLLEALRGYAGAHGMERIEVGLPSERFAGLHRTRAFYTGNGFEPIGLRMRCDL